ncbi:MSC_0882 family membrane protein [Metamycoplasma buccale]|uniref:MSC_0882 family membrane protein n=1 Tax=Metamycoplasma buccale TaxID=55602 RepID=UPI00398ED6D2
MALKPILSVGELSAKDLEKTTLTVKSLADEVREVETLQTRALSTKKDRLKDPQGIIPNGIYKVFSLEKNLKIFMLSITSVIFLFSFITCFLFAYTPSLFKVDASKVTWAWYIGPVLIMGISLFIFIIDLLDFLGINKSIVVYRTSIQQGAITTPPFIALLYRKLMMKQVRRTWLIVSILFYVGLFTLIFWGLQDQKWGKLDFKKWIHNSFPNPNVVVYLLCIVMIVSVALFIANTIFRKKRMVDIESFFGTEVMNYNDLQDKKSKAHRFYAKIFFISILVLLILPFVIYIVLKKTIWKGK